MRKIFTFLGLKELRSVKVKKKKKTKKRFSTRLDRKRDELKNELRMNRREKGEKESSIGLIDIKFSVSCSLYDES